MSSGIEFLTIYAEICLGTTAFFAIVATLRQTLGESLTEYQYLIMRFFVDTGLQLVVISIIGLAVFSFDTGGELSWQIMAYLILIANCFYTPYYFARRSKVDAPSSRIAVLVTVMIVLPWINLMLVVFGLSQMPLPIAVLVSLVTIFTSKIAVFLIFIGSFMRVTPVKS